jgi:hypothetical protein
VPVPPGSGRPVLCELWCPEGRDLPGLWAGRASASNVLPRVWAAAGGIACDDASASPGGGSHPVPTRILACPRRRVRPRPHAGACPAGVHPHVPGREDPHVPCCPGRRAQAGHGALCRSQRLTRDHPRP